MIRESELPIKQVVTTEDIVRIVTSDGRSQNAVVASLAQTVVENYEGIEIEGTFESVYTAVTDLHQRAGELSTSVSMLDTELDTQSGQIDGINRDIQSLSNTMSGLEQHISDIVSNILYPVGAYLWTSDSTFRPADAYGGTWELLDEGIALVSAGQTYTVRSGTAKDGGAATHTLTIAEMPSHTHTQNAHKHTAPSYNQSGYATGSTNRRYPVSVSDPGRQADWATADATATNQNTGGGGAHNNMPPYKCAYCWHRTA